MFDRFALNQGLLWFYIVTTEGFLIIFKPFFQAAVYGIGVCAEFGRSMFKPLVGGILL